MCEVQANHVVPIVFLRGLHARCLWVTAQLNSAEFGHGDAQIEAFMQGREDYDCGRGPNEIPSLLADVRELAAAWQEGWDFACEVDISKGASCRYCSEVGVEVCGFHD